MQLSLQTGRSLLHVAARCSFPVIPGATLTYRTASARFQITLRSFLRIHKREPAHTGALLDTEYAEQKDR